MFGLGPAELVIILILVVFFFGGKKLGQLGDGLGKSISEFKKAVRTYPGSPDGPQIRSEGGDGASGQEKTVSPPPSIEPSRRGEIK